MKIWSDSLSYLNSIRGGYMLHVERILSGKYNNKCNGGYQYLDSSSPDKRASYDADRSNRGDDCDDDDGKECATYALPQQVTYLNRGSDCGDDDDQDGGYKRPARTYSNVWTQFSQNQGQVYRLAGHRLQLPNTLHIQPCDTSHHLICNPVEAGKIAVIDGEALSLLERFRVPTTLREVIATSNSTSTCLLAITLIFLDLHFLCDLDQEPVTRSEPSRGSTLSAWLHITNACNLRCHYCYISKTPDHMEQETSRRAVDAIIRSAVRHNYERVHLLRYETPFAFENTFSQKI
jgi:hypothetical protein